MLGPTARINGVSPDRCLVLYLETTGVSNTDEILRISATDGYGRGVMNQRFSTDLPLSPFYSSDIPSFKSIEDRVERYFHLYDCIISYDLTFETKILKSSGLNVSNKNWKLVDVRNIYSTLKENLSQTPLRVAASQFGYKPYNDGFDEPRMTLWVLEWLMYGAERNGFTIGHLANS